LRPLTVGEVSITVSPDEEEEAPDLWDDLPKEVRDYKVLELYKEHAWNPWKWCCVCVEVRWRGLCSATYLGMCSYDSEEDFLLCDYYADMVDEALAELNTMVEALQRPSCSCKPAEVNG
jgi:hypothetical protein